MSDRHHPVVLTLGGVEHRRAGFDAGVVDHDVDAAELADGRVDEFLGVGKFADVGVDADRLVTESGNLLLDRLGGLGMNDIVDHDAGTVPCQFENDCLADPAIAAGDYGNLVL